MKIQESTCTSRFRFAWALISALLAVSGSVAITAASPISVTNGGFDQVAVNQSQQIGYNGQSVTGWNADGRFNMVMLPGTADSPGALQDFQYFRIYGPQNGANNGLTDTSPVGGNFIELDGDPTYSNPVSQTLAGLTVGSKTTVSFFFAGAQQVNFTGPTTEQMKVSLGDQTQFSPVLANPEGGFTGWQQYSLTFIPTSVSEVLSFLAVGTPSGAPPVSLLDGITVNDDTPDTSTPEPSSMLPLSGGLLLLVVGTVRSSRRKRNL